MGRRCPFASNDSLTMIAQSLKHLQDELPDGVKLVAVSKFHPVERLMEAYNAGQRIFAESRPQELAAKVPQMPSDVRWHFIGHLQTNKLKLVLPYVSLVQSVDSLHLLQAISAWAVANEKPVNVLLEMHLGAEETKQGFSEEEILDLLEKPAPEGVRICGLMGMATNTDDQALIESDFKRIEALFKSLRAKNLPFFDELSIGMSHDWRLAIRHSATMVRIGTDIFGPREY